MEKYNLNKDENAIKAVVDPKKIVTSDLREKKKLPIVLDPKRFLGHDPNKADKTQ